MACCAECARGLGGCSCGLGDADGGTFFGIPMMTWDEFEQEVHPESNPIAIIGQGVVGATGMQPAVNAFGTAAADTAGAANTGFTIVSGLTDPSSTFFQSAVSLLAIGVSALLVISALEGA